MAASPVWPRQRRRKLHEKYPELTICGMHDGYFQDEGPILSDINEKKPDVLLVCLGSPKQEQFMWHDSGRI